MGLQRNVETGKRGLVPGKNAASMVLTALGPVLPRRLHPVAHGCPGGPFARSCRHGRGTTHAATGLGGHRPYPRLDAASSLRGLLMAVASDPDALARLDRAIQRLPRDDPWRPGLVRRRSRLARALGLRPLRLVPEAPPELPDAPTELPVARPAAAQPRQVLG